MRQHAISVIRRDDYAGHQFGCCRALAKTETPASASNWRNASAVSGMSLGFRRSRSPRRSAALPRFRRRDDLEVVFKLALASEAVPERLTAAVVAVTVMFEHAPCLPSLSATAR
jgi:hypothetical protein